LNEPGPIAPLIASVEAERLFGDDLEFDGIDIPNSSTPTIAVPAGYGHYCSVRDRSNGSFGLQRLGAGSDPCQPFLDQNPNVTIERAGLYSLHGENTVIAHCGSSFVTKHHGIGTTPIDQAFAATSGREECIFNVVPETLRVFSRPYTGGHLSGNSGNSQAFNNRGRQRSIGEPGVNCVADGSGVDEAAVDIPVNSSRIAVAMAPGRVVMAIPRHVSLFAPPGNDPYQREVFIRHQVGSGRYAEVFTAYVAHMTDTRVRYNDLVVAGTEIGRIGNTGASFGEHLHIALSRNRNLSWRREFEFTFLAGAWDRNAVVSNVNPWGWKAPAGFDPWGYRFRSHPDPQQFHLHLSGAFSSDMWLPGEAPTQF
jgi:Peptidase family M23